MGVFFKKDLINTYAEKEDVTKAEAERRIDSVFKIILNELFAGNDVRLNNFFNFFLKTRRAKPGKNPLTGQDFVIPEVKTVLVRMTKPVKDVIQGKREHE